MGTTTLVPGIYLSRPEVPGSPEFKCETADAFLNALNKNMLQFFKLLKPLRRKRLGMEIDDEPTTSLNSGSGSSTISVVNTAASLALKKS